MEVPEIGRIDDSNYRYRQVEDDPTPKLIGLVVSWVEHASPITFDNCIISVSNVSTSLRFTWYFAGGSSSCTR